MIEIACDESGSEGENLIRANTDVFAHASVRLSGTSAADCVTLIRDRVRSPALEYKSNHLLREKHRSVLTWLLGTSGPIHGHARVHLTDKAFFVVGRVVDLLLGEVTDAADMAVHLRSDQARARALTLYRDGPRVLGRERWSAFLRASNDVLHTKPAQDPDTYLRLLDKLRVAAAGSPVGEVMAQLRQSGPHARSLEAQLPALDLLIPAIVRAVDHWGDGSRPVSVVHDQQTALTDGRIALLKDILGDRLTSLSLVDSRSDSRVQIADFLAGVARKIASDELNNRGDAELTTLLRPYVDPFSIWGDQQSWALLGPPSLAAS